MPLPVLVPPVGVRYTMLWAAAAMSILIGQEAVGVRHLDRHDGCPRRDPLHPAPVRLRCSNACYRGAVAVVILIRTLPRDEAEARDALELGEAAIDSRVYDRDHHALPSVTLRVSIARLMRRETPCRHLPQKWTLRRAPDRNVLDPWMAPQMDRSNPGKFGDQDREDSESLFDRAAEVTQERRVPRQDRIPEADRQGHLVARRGDVVTRGLEVP